MSSTTVHSKNTGKVAGSVFIPTEKTLEIPPKSQVLKAIPSYVEEQGNIEISVGNGYITKNGLVKADGTTIPMKNENAFNNIANSEQIKLKAKVAKEMNR